MTTAAGARPMRFPTIVFTFFVLVFAGVNFAPGQAHAQAGVTTLSCTPPPTDPEIASLARALNYNISQIYEYVYFNVEFSPTFGSKKGALGTFLDRRGNNFDQNVLFVTLLRQSCITANYRYGTVGIGGAAIANLLGVQNDAGILSNVFAYGGIPACVIVSGACATTGGAATSVNVGMVWTEATVGSTTYELDPSFKSYTQYTPINVAAATGYNQSTFLSGALGGSSTGSGIPAGVTSLKNLSKTSITNNLNLYSQNLANYIKTTYPTSSAKQLFGGREINYNNFGATLPTGGTLYTTLPTTFETVYTVTVSDNANGTSPTISTTLYGSQIQGRRLTLTYNTSNKPVLTLEGTVLATGAATAVATQTVSFTVTTLTPRPSIRLRPARPPKWAAFMR